MKINWKQLILCIAIPLAVGAAAAFLTRDSMAAFGMLNQPELSPPGWLFPVVWTILYVLMGIASYLVLSAEKSQRVQNALVLYGLQLVVNFFWSIIFFGLGQYLFAFIWLILLWVLILLTMEQFSAISKTAAYLLVPYLLWVTFAGCLNWAIYRLN